MSKSSWLYAINEVQRVDPKAEVKEGKPAPIEIVSAQRVFEPASDKEAKALLKLGAVRLATEDEITLEKERLARIAEESEEEEVVSEIVASVPQNSPAKGKAPKAVQPQKPAEDEEVL